MRRFLAALMLLGLVAAGCDLEETDTGATDTGAATEDSSAEGSEPAPQPRSIEPIKFSGSGKKATDAFEVEGGVTIFRMEHTGGSSNFAVQLLDGSSGELKELLANEIGGFKGSKLVGLEAGSYVLDIEADSNWAVTIEQPRPADGPTPPQTFTGDGPEAVGPIKFDGGLARFAMKHSGDGNFAITLHDSTGSLVDLLVNEIGSFEGDDATGVGTGLFWFDVTANGPWSLAVTV